LAFLVIIADETVTIFNKCADLQMEEFVNVDICRFVNEIVK